MTSAAPAYAALAQRHARLYRLEHLQALASWDRMTYMPANSAPARAEALAEFSALLNEMRQDPELDALFGRAAGEQLGADEAANLAVMRRQHALERALPAELTARRQTLTSAATQTWMAARAANDWSAFAKALQPVIALVREEAERIGQALGLARYDALLEKFDPGLRQARVDALFGDVATWLPGIVAAAVERQRQQPAIEPQGPFEPAKQKALCEQIMARLGFDFSRGRLDVSAHPFTGGVPEDVRLTTRYAEHSVLPAVLAAMHETGHARYQQNLPEAWLHQPLGAAASASVHEAQALSFERQLAPRAAFAAVLAPMLRESFGDQPAFAPDNVLRLMQRVRPSKIRVEADELTYPAHIILRVDIERRLVNGEIEIEDVPALWDDAMARLLQIDTTGDFANGPMQDIHWPQGMFGYFPAYLLGAMIAAQLFAAFKRAHPDFEQQLAQGEFAALGNWLRSTIWAQGSRYSSEALVERATGAPLSAAALRAHFEARYLGGSATT